jgi:hypothetical protein
MTAEEIKKKQEQSMLHEQWKTEDAQAEQKKRELLLINKERNLELFRHN